MCGSTAQSFDRGQLESNTGYGVVENIAASWHIYLFFIAFLPQSKSWQCFFCSVLDCSIHLVQVVVQSARGPANDTSQHRRARIQTSGYQDSRWQVCMLGQNTPLSLCNRAFAY